MSQETEQLGETPEAQIRELVYGSLHPVHAKMLLTELLQEVDEELQGDPNELSPEHHPHKWEDVSDDPFPKESNQ